MTFITKRLERSASYFTGSRYYLLTVLVALFGVFFHLALTQTLNYTNNPKKYSLLDAKFGFYPSTAYDLLRALGPRGRRGYQIINYVDFVMFPTILAHWLAATMPGPTDVTNSWNDKVFWASNYLISDVVENTCIWRLLRKYPAEYRNVAVIASLAGIVKWTSVLLCLLLITWRSLTRVGKEKNKH